MLPSRPLFNPDEGRYAEIPREMLAGGDWIIPHLDGVPYIEKPPLQYWATALSLKIFGFNAFAARLYTALCAFGTFVMVGVVGRELWGCEVAVRSAAVLASLLLFVVLGQLLTLDMSLTFYMTLGLAGFLLAQPPVGGQRPRASVVCRRWMLVAWGAVALGVLTKGLVAAAIPAAVLVCYSLYARDIGPWRRLQPSWGLPLFAVIAVPWHWLAARRLPDFLEFFFVHEHLARYLTPAADREEAWWFFGAVFALGTIPWTASAVRVMVAPPRVAPGRFDATAFLWIWAVFVIVFFSLSDSKLIPYILPAIPAVALLIGASPAASLRRDSSIAASFTVALGAALFVGALVAPRFLASTDRNHYFLQLAAPLMLAGPLVAAAGLFVLLRRGDATRAAVTLSVGWCLAGVLLMRGAAAVAPIYSGVELVRALEQVPRGAPIYSVATYDQTLPFYSRRTFELVAYRGELDFGLKAVPAAEIPDVADFVRRWQTLAQGYAVMEKSMFDDLKARGVPMRELARDVHRVLVTRS